LEVLQTIRELPGQSQVSKLVAVTDFGEATRSQIELLQKLLAADPKFLPGGREVSWVFFLDITRYPHLLPETSPEIFNLVKKHLVVLPPLSDRLTDLATYLMHHVGIFAGREENPLRARLSPAAVAVLLDHTWPGNYAEVLDMARRIAATEREEPLTAPQAAQLLGHDAVAEGGLRPYLLHRQLEFIEDSARRAGLEAVAMLQSLKPDPSLLPPSGKLEDLGLLYPDLLPGG
jgi:hypothetical protein